MRGGNTDASLDIQHCPPFTAHMHKLGARLILSCFVLILTQIFIQMDVLCNVPTQMYVHFNQKRLIAITVLFCWQLSPYIMSSIAAKSFLHRE